VVIGSSGSCHFRTHAPQQIAFLLDHLVGAGEQRRWHHDAERLRGVEIDDQFDPSGLYNGQVSRLFALENPASVDPT
jgi:hypothetical protein